MAVPAGLERAAERDLGEPAGAPGLAEIAREWARIGITGFGGPPTHIAMLRDLCVSRRRWLSAAELQDAIAATSLLPGPASTQLAIFCAWRLRGWLGALVGGAGFILPGLAAILALSSLYLTGAPPAWIAGAAAGAGAGVPAVAARAGLALMPASLATAGGRSSRARWALYVLIGAVGAASIGAWLVLALVSCGLLEMTWRRAAGTGDGLALHLWPLLLGVAATAGGTAALAWVALKVGALSYGGGFVIVPLMQSDAVSHYHWMTSSQFLGAVALGQITPGPVVATVAVVGYAAGGVLGGLLAALIAFAPSFCFVMLGGRHFDKLRGNAGARAFLAGAGPAAIGAILGSAIPLAAALRLPWQLALMAAAAVSLLILRRGVVETLLAAGLVGALLGLLGLA